MGLLVQWRDGTVDDAPDAASFLRSIADGQWSREDADNVKAALAWRAHNMGYPLVDVSLSDDDFVRAMAGVGFWQIIVG